MLRILFLAVGIFAANGVAEAHTPQSRASVSVTVSTGWSWVPGHWVYVNTRTANHTVSKKHKWIRGHWIHRTHGKSFRSKQLGPPRHHMHNRRARHTHRR